MENSNVSVEKKGFFSGLIHEFKRVVWPTRRETMKNIGVVLSSIFLIGTFVFLLDKAFGEALKKLMTM